MIFIDMKNDMVPCLITYKCIFEKAFEQNKLGGKEIVNKKMHPFEKCPHTLR